MNDREFTAFRDKWKMRAMAWTIFLLVFALVATNFFQLGMLGHSRQLKDLQERLERLDVPPDTRRIYSFSELGGLYGSGDNCDYAVAAYYETRLSKEDDASIRGIDSEVELGVSVLFKDEGINGDKLGYMLHVFDEAHDAGFDFRCM